MCVETNMWKDRQELIQDGCRQPLINQTWLIHEDWELAKITGWWFQPTTSEKYDIVSWDDDIPNIWKNTFLFQTTRFKR